MAGEPDIVEKCKKGHKAGAKKFKVHLDGFNLLPFLTTEGVESPREGFIYFDDDGNLVAVRMNNWKFVFLEQRCEGTLRIWMEPFTVLRTPKAFNLRTDPLERADITSNTYYDWFLSKAYRLLAAQAIVGKFMETFRDFPPRQKAASFTVEQAHDKIQSSASSSQ
jgi:arylsulfatase